MLIKLLIYAEKLRKWRKTIQFNVGKLELEINTFFGAFNDGTDTGTLLLVPVI